MKKRSVRRMLKLRLRQQKKKRKSPLTHARVIRISPRRRMALSIKDMPKYPGTLAPLAAPNPRGQ